MLQIAHTLLQGAAAASRCPAACGVASTTAALARANASFAASSTLAFSSSTSSGCADSGTSGATSHVEASEVGPSLVVHQDDEPPQLPSQPQLVDAYLGTGTMSQQERLKARKAEVIRPFQRFEGDVGSPEVQVALLTDRIRSLGPHFKANKKDFHGLRGLQGMLNQRRALLSYLRRRDFQRFAFVLRALGLTDVYAMQTRYDKYRVGTRLGDAAEPIKRYKTR